MTDDLEKYEALTRRVRGTGDVLECVAAITELIAVVQEARIAETRALVRSNDWRHRVEDAERELAELKRKMRESDKNIAEIISTRTQWTVDQTK